MKPSALRPGMCVRRRDRAAAPLLTFVCRDRLHRQSVLQSDAYRGQNGPEDEGHVVVSDHDMARHYQAAPLSDTDGRSPLISRSGLPGRSPASAATAPRAARGSVAAALLRGGGA